MRLKSFRIINCFGFRDSGQVNLDDPKSLIYILGRNSSGKSSLLTALRYFGSDRIPKDHARCINFNDNGQTQRLIAEFELTEELIDSQKLFDHFLAVFSNNGINANDMKMDPFHKRFSEVKECYQELIDQLNSSKIIRVEKQGNGAYLFLDDNFNYEGFRARSKRLSTIFDGNAYTLVESPKREVRMPFFQSFENALFLLFPKIILFNEQYRLNDELPDRITSDLLKPENRKGLLNNFLSIIGEDNVKGLLQSNDPDDREVFLISMQNAVDSFIENVNHRDEDASNNTALLRVKLHENNGLQITIITEDKKSFYSHISENTKFLFAYYLHLQTNDINENILLFDEPNNGFHPTAQDFILDFLKKLAKNNTVVVSTHSEHLIDPDHISGIRLMRIDKNKNIYVRNHFYDQAKKQGDYLALQPLWDAIGLKYAKLITIRDKVIITEGITDLLYLRAFNSILKYEGELNIAPARSASHILSLIPLLISQGVSFKIVIDKDKDDIKGEIINTYDLNEDFIFEIPIPSDHPTMKTSGIEDLFSRIDFRNLIGDDVSEEFEHVSNSFYVREGAYKRLIAEELYKRAEECQPEQFEDFTISSFRKVLDFCKRDRWFNL
jgi:predicted ATP-dependent endonuclease of OLD family